MKYGQDWLTILVDRVQGLTNVPENHATLSFPHDTNQLTNGRKVNISVPTPEESQNGS